ncbi:MAG TPA: FliM/FliN family flagellar motor C-terminal domain-containing protein [Candidatus Eisenbacteria bacterium]
MSRVLTPEEIAALRAQPFLPAPRERYRVSVEAGSTQLEPARIAALEPGDVIPLERRIHEPVEILANAVPVALGELIVQDGLAAVRVVRVLRPGRPARGTGRP